MRSDGIFGFSRKMSYLSPWWFLAIQSYLDWDSWNTGFQLDIWLLEFLSFLMDLNVEKIRFWPILVNFGWKSRNSKCSAHLKKNVFWPILKIFCFAQFWAQSNTQVPSAPINPFLEALGVCHNFSALSQAGRSLAPQSRFGFKEIPRAPILPFLESLGIPILPFLESL